MVFIYNNSKFHTIQFYGNPVIDEAERALAEILPYVVEYSFLSTLFSSTET